MALLQRGEAKLTDEAKILKNRRRGEKDDREEEAERKRDVEQSEYNYF